MYLYVRGTRTSLGRWVRTAYCGNPGSSTSRIKEADLLFVLRKDRKRLHRVLELLEVFEEQKQARATENVDEMAKSYDKEA